MRLASKEFIRLMNKLDDLSEKLVAIELELREVRHQVNLAIIDEKLEP